MHPPRRCRPILALKRWTARLPAALVAVVLGIAASMLLGLPALGVKTIGEIPAGLPPPVLPDLGLAPALWPAALAIALMSFTESIASGRAFATPGQERPAPNREVVATGAGNALGGLRVRRGVDRSPLGQRLGRARMFFDLEHAVAAYRKHVCKDQEGEGPDSRS